jgi:hypothetical protein
LSTRYESTLKSDVFALGSSGNSFFGTCNPRTQTPGGVVLLEREVSTLEFFETLESDRDEGFVQRRGKAHERRSLERETEARGRFPRRESKAARGSTGETG